MVDYKKNKIEELKFLGYKTNGDFKSLNNYFFFNTYLKFLNNLILKKNFIFFF